MSLEEIELCAPRLSQEDVDGLMEARTDAVRGYTKRIVFLLIGLAMAIVIAIKVREYLLIVFMTLAVMGLIVFAFRRRQAHKSGLLDAYAYGEQNRFEI